MMPSTFLRSQKDEERYEVGHEREQRTKMKLLFLVLLVLAALSVYSTYGWILEKSGNERPFMLMGVPTVVDTGAGSGITLRIKSICNETLFISSLKLKEDLDGNANASGVLTITAFSCREIPPGELVQITAFSPVPLEGSSYEAYITINGKNYSFVARRNT